MVTQLLQHWSKHRHLFHTLSHQAWFNSVQYLISDEQRSICCQLQISRPPLGNKLLPFEFTISVAKYMDHLYIIYVQIYNSGILLHSLKTANKHNHHSKSPLHQGTKSHSNLSQLTHQPLQTATSHKGMHIAKPSSAFFLNTMQYSHLLLKRSTTSTEDYLAHRGLLHPDFWNYATDTVNCHYCTIKTHIQMDTQERTIITAWKLVLWLTTDMISAVW